MAAVRRSAKQSETKQKRNKHTQRERSRLWLKQVLFSADRTLTPFDYRRCFVFLFCFCFVSALNLTATLDNKVCFATLWPAWFATWQHVFRRMSTQHWPIASHLARTRFPRSAPRLIILVNIHASIIILVFFSYDGCRGRRLYEHNLNG